MLFIKALSKQRKLPTDNANSRPENITWLCVWKSSGTPSECVTGGWWVGKISSKGMDLWMKWRQHQRYSAFIFNDRLATTTYYWIMIGEMEKLPRSDKKSTMSCEMPAMRKSIFKETSVQFVFNKGISALKVQTLSCIVSCFGVFLAVLFWETFHSSIAI